MVHVYEYSGTVNGGTGMGQPENVSTGLKWCNQQQMNNHLCYIHVSIYSVVIAVCYMFKLKPINPYSALLVISHCGILHTGSG